MQGFVQICTIRRRAIIEPQARPSLTSLHPYPDRQVDAETNLPRESVRRID